MDSGSAEQYPSDVLPVDKLVFSFAGSFASLVSRFGPCGIPFSEFHEMDLEMTLKALAELEAVGKAAVFGADRSDQLVGGVSIEKVTYWLAVLTFIDNCFLALLRNGLQGVKFL